MGLSSEERSDVAISQGAKGKTNWCAGGWYLARSPIRSTAARFLGQGVFHGPPPGKDQLTSAALGRNFAPRPTAMMRSTRIPTYCLLIALVCLGLLVWAVL